MPYIVGRWVRGQNHYGRQRLINYLLDVPDTAMWLVGTRRIGKTSILRRLEELTTHAESNLEPLFWDLQGCETPQDFLDELQYALDDSFHRFEPYGLTRADLDAHDAVSLLRRVAGRLHRHDRRLFLLIDEAEALLTIGATHPSWLARLRKAFQDGRQRTVMTSTKRLMQLNELGSDWLTSPFLFGFSLVNLWSLDPDSSVDLVRQKQSEASILVDDDLLHDVLHATNRHPYLLQYLCQRLFEVDGQGQGMLRPIQPQDLIPDHLLTGFFQIDFQHLSTTERRILLAIARLSVADESELMHTLYDLEPRRLRTFLYGLNKLGYVRQIDDQWTIGNEYLRHWVHDNLDHLDEMQESAIRDASVEAVVSQGLTYETIFLRGQIAQLQEQLEQLEHRAAIAAPQPPIELVRQIDVVGQSLSTMRRELALLLPAEKGRVIHPL